MVAIMAMFAPRGPAYYFLFNDTAGSWCWWFGNGKWNIRANYFVHIHPPNVFGVHTHSSRLLCTLLPTTSPGALRKQAESELARAGKDRWQQRIPVESGQRAYRWQSATGSHGGRGQQRDHPSVLP